MPTPSDTPRWRPSRRLGWVAGIVALAAVALIAAAVIPGSHSSHGRQRSSVAATVAAQRSAPQVRARVSKVFGSKIAAQRYGTQIAEQEAGIDSSGTYVSDLTPLKPSAFDRPFARFRVYSEHRAIAMSPDAAALTAALRSGDRAAARRRWLRCWGDYLRLGAAYGLLPGDLDDALADVPDSLGARRFPGLHYIERGLWTGQSLRSLVGPAVALQRAVGRLRHTLPTLAIDPVDYAARAHEILEDAQRDLLSGTEVPWSGAGVLGTAAGLDATRELIRTLAPIMQGRGGTLVAVQNLMPRLARTLRSLRRRDGSWPTIHELSTEQRERLNAAMTALLTQLQRIPATVETQVTPKVPTIPKESSR